MVLRIPLLKLLTKKELFLKLKRRLLPILKEVSLLYLKLERSSLFVEAVCLFKYGLDLVSRHLLNLYSNREIDIFKFLSGT